MSPQCPRHHHHLVPTTPSPCPPCPCYAHLRAHHRAPPGIPAVPLLCSHHARHCTPTPTRDLASQIKPTCTLVAPQGEGHGLVGVGKTEKAMGKCLGTVLVLVGTSLPLPGACPLGTDGSHNAKVRGLALTTQTLVSCWAVLNTQTGGTASLCTSPCPCPQSCPGGPTHTPEQPDTGGPCWEGKRVPRDRRGLHPSHPP